MLTRVLVLPVLQMPAAACCRSVRESVAAVACGTQQCQRWRIPGLRVEVRSHEVITNSTFMIAVLAMMERSVNLCTIQCIASVVGGKSVCLFVLSLTRDYA